MRIAIALRGGVSRRGGNYQSFIGQSGLPFIDIAACAKSFQENIMDCNSGHAIDVYIHSWSEEAASLLKAGYRPYREVYEDNTKYKNLIRNYAEESFKNLSKLNRGLETKHDVSQGIPGISQALAIQKVFQLVLTEENRLGQYDAIFFYRPDLILTKPVYFSSYSMSGVTCNNFMDRMGDFHFFVPRVYADQFSNIIKSISWGNYEEVHHWIKRYVENFLKIDYFQDDIVAGIHQEVLRKIRNSKISLKTARKYGLSKATWNSYDVEG